jgi:hypothetical protein
LPDPLLNPDRDKAVDLRTNAASLYMDLDHWARPTNNCP